MSDFNGIILMNATNGECISIQGGTTQETNVMMMNRTNGTAHFAIDPRYNSESMRYGIVSMKHDTEDYNLILMDWTPCDPDFLPGALKAFALLHGVTY